MPQGRPPVMKAKGQRTYPPIRVEAKELSEDEYDWRATRIDLDTMSLVVVECVHPNVGYWEEMCVFVSTMHDPEWECIPLSNFWIQWRDPREFLRSFPAFKKLFRPRDFIGEVLGSMGIDVSPRKHRD